MDIEWEDTPSGGKTRSGIDGDWSGGGQLEFLKPNIMVLHIPVPNKIFRMHAICVPTRHNETSLIVVGARSFATWRLLNPFFNHSNMKIVREDQAVVESSQPAEVPAPAQEKSVRTDRATLRFRRYYFAELKHSSAIQ